MSVKGRLFEPYLEYDYTVSDSTYNHYYWYYFYYYRRHHHDIHHHYYCILLCFYFHCHLHSRSLSYVLPILVCYVFFPQFSPARLQILHPLFKNCLVFVTKQSFSLGFLESLYF